MKHHLIFEGAELSGKSWIMSQIYNHLEPKYNESGFVLDGCHWFNCDIGVYGTENGKKIIEGYINIFKNLKNKNLIIEKFHISEKVYSFIYRNKKINYQAVEKKLNNLGFKIIFIKFSEKIDVIKKRIEDRLRLYPHYEKILKSPEWYLNQQKFCEEEIKKSKLPFLIIEADELPSQEPISKILKWIDEK